MSQYLDLRSPGCQIQRSVAAGIIEGRGVLQVEVVLNRPLTGCIRAGLMVCGAYFQATQPRDMTSQMGYEQGLTTPGMGTDN